MALCVQIVVFQVVTLCSLVEDTRISEKHSSSIFRVKVGQRHGDVIQTGCAEGGHSDPQGGRGNSLVCVI
jgi:hypothetical protein